MTTAAESEAWAVYGAPPPVLAPVPPRARQVSPLIPDASSLEDLAEASLDRMTVLAPPGALERRYVLAQALRALKPGGALVALAPKDRGGSRLRGELQSLGCAVAEEARRHHRICTARAPGDAAAIASALTGGGVRWREVGLGEAGFWTQPGVFSWDRPDPGTTLLAAHLPALAGRGADFGCGAGLLARAVLAQPGVAELELVDIDARAIALARRNVDDERARFRQADLRRASGGARLDFVVMNPPFHLAGVEDRGLGEAFIAAAAAALRPGGVCLLVANVTLPYERALETCFARLRQVVRRDGFKVLEAVK